MENSVLFTQLKGPGLDTQRSKSVSFLTENIFANSVQVGIFQTVYCN